MRVGTAKALARQWVQDEAVSLPGFAGAFLHGSLNWLSDDAVLSPASDVDIMVILDDPDPPLKPGKFVHHSILFEGSLLPRQQLETPQQILGDYHLAGSFQAAAILADPGGWLAERQQAVTANYARREWVYARCKHAEANLLRNLRSIRGSSPWHDQVMAWLFGTGITTHLVLVAALKNPTVRRRYAAAREVLADYGHCDVHEEMLALSGCAAITRARTEWHLNALEAVFDVAKTHVKTPFFFTSDITDAARPIAIEGSRSLIEAGCHREAIFWIVATYARCCKILYHDAPVAVQAEFLPGFQSLLGDLGIRTTVDMLAGRARVEAFLPRLWAVVEVILAENPDVLR